MDSSLKNRKLTIVTEEGRIVTDCRCMYDGLLRMKLPNGALLVGFADDLVLLVVAEKSWLVEIITNDALELIAEWLTSRFLQLTVRKCEAMLVTRQRKNRC